MDKMNSLTAAEYQFGSCRRKNFRGYSLYDYFELSEFSVTNRHGNFFFADYWMEYLQKQKYFTEDLRDLYEKDMKKYFQDNAILWDLSNESLYGRLTDKREQVLKKRMKDKAEKVLHQEKMRILLEGCQEIPCEKIEENSFIEYGINQQAFLDHFLYKREVVIVAVSSLKWAPVAVQKAKELLYHEKEVYLLLKEKSTSPVFTAKEFETEEFTEKFFSDFWTNGIKPELLRCRSDDFGIRFDRISVSEKLEAAIRRQEVMLIGFGEDILLSVHDLSVPSVVFCKAESVYAKSVLNVYDGNALSIVYIPEEFNIFPYVPVIEAPEITYAQYAGLAKRYGPAIYKEEPCILKKRCPEYFINVFSDRLEKDKSRPVEAERAENFEMPAGIFKDIGDLMENLLQRNRVAQKWLGKEKGYTSFIRLHNFAKESGEKAASASMERAGSFRKPDYTLISGLITDSPRKAEVMRIENYGSFSFRTCMRNSGMLQPPKYLCNFLLYFTPKLLAQYNRIRKDRPEEQLQTGSFYLDYYQERRNGESHCTFPLFNKACIAKSRTGEIRFFHYQLGGGRLCFGDISLKWRSGDVNPLQNGPEQEIILYTPMLSERDGNIRNNKEKQTTEYRREAGENRLNLIIVGEQIICMRQGSVILPSIGVVVSLDGRMREEVETRLKAPLDKNGYYRCSPMSVKIELDPPEDMEISEWRNMQWTFGGGMMIEDSRCIFDENPKEAFQKEGWLTPLSIQTQESSVHDEEERHPRTMIGLCGNEKLFLIVFSGRSRHIRGVTYREACSLAREYIPDIRYMMAVDGGASSVLGIAGNDTFMELSYPACNIENGTGIVRRINSIFMV